MIQRLPSTTARIVSLIIALALTLSSVKADDLDNIVFEGIVRDSAGAVLPAAKVVAVRVETGLERQGVTWSGIPIPELRGLEEYYDYIQWIAEEIMPVVK